MHVEPATWAESEDSTMTENQQPARQQPATGQGDVLQALVQDAVETYLKDLGDMAGRQTKGQLYELLLHRVELPLLQAVLKHVQQNQTRAARILGLNRGTLRKKMQLHGLLGK